MSFEKAYYWILILGILMVAWISFNTVLDGTFLLMSDTVKQAESGIEQELIGGFLEQFDKISLDVIPRN